MGMLIIMVSLALAASLVQAEEPRPYPGLLSEMKAADLIVLVKAEETASSEGRDPRTGGIVELQVRGTITEVYKGKAKKGQKIEIEVPYAELTLRSDELERVGYLFFVSGPRRDESVVFLLKGPKREVINITYEHPLIAEYARISQLKTDAETAFALAELYAKLRLIDNKYGYRIWYLIADDLKRYYKHLDVESRGFAELVNHYRDAIFRAVKEDGWQGRLFPAIWLGSYLPRPDRQALVKILLDRYAANARKIEELKKLPPEPERVPAPNEGVSAAGGAPAPKPLHVCRQLENTLIGSMSMIVDPSWHRLISDVLVPGEVVPWDLIWAKELSAKDVLAKANEFVGS